MGVLMRVNICFFQGHIGIPQLGEFIRDDEPVVFLGAPFADKPKYSTLQCLWLNPHVFYGPSFVCVCCKTFTGTFFLVLIYLT